MENLRKTNKRNKNRYTINMRIRRKKKGKSLHRRQNKTRHGKRGGMKEGVHTPSNSALAISKEFDPVILSTDPERLTDQQSGEIKSGANRGIQELVSINGSSLMTEYDKQKQAAINASTEKQDELRKKFDEVTGEEDNYVKSITQEFIEGDGDDDADYQKRYIKARSMFDGFKHKKEQLEEHNYNEFISIGASTDIEGYKAIIKSIYDSLAVILTIFLGKRREVIEKERAAAEAAKL